MSGSIKAFLVWDGGDEVRVPPDMGVPRADQLQGTVREKLAEVAGRSCYDSVGTGRPSMSGSCAACLGNGKVAGVACTWCKGKGAVEGFHGHIQSVKHYSVYEHCVFTLVVRDFNINGRFVTRSQEWAFMCRNRPGVFVREGADGNWRVTLNARALIEWDRMSRELAIVDFHVERFPLFACANGGNALMPNVFNQPNARATPVFAVVPPEHPHEKWVSLFLSGSRGFSHEMVRHGEWSAISQRSTRYVQESISPYVSHPLFVKFMEEGCPGSHPDILAQKDFDATRTAREAYDMNVSVLEKWLKSTGVDGLTARKQARGAARGYLGNALQTEMIFSASVQQWRWMLDQRGSAAADAEIRELFAGPECGEHGEAHPDSVLGCLQASRYAADFSDYIAIPSPDGIACVVQKK